MSDQSGPSQTNASHPQHPAEGGKVGSDRAADAQIGGKLDFGIPADRAKAPRNDGGREKGPEQGTGPMRTGQGGVRDQGVGATPGGPGAGSGGDLDPDIDGFDGKGGLSAKPASGRTQGPDDEAAGRGG